MRERNRAKDSSKILNKSISDAGKEDVPSGHNFDDDSRNVLKAMKMRRKK